MIEQIPYRGAEMLGTRNINELLGKMREVVDAVNELQTIVSRGPDDDELCDGQCCARELGEDQEFCTCHDPVAPLSQHVPITMLQESRAAALLNDFVGYCHKHPELRFWQALHGWSGYKSIHGQYVDKLHLLNDEDTYHKTTKGPNQ